MKYNQARQVALQKLLQSATEDTSVFCQLFRPQVFHPSAGSTLFVPYSYQKDYFRALDAGKNCIVVKARQIGFSIATAVFLLRKCLKEHTHCLIVSIAQDEARDLLKKTREIKNLCYPRYPLNEKHNNVDRLEFANGSRIEVTPSSPDAGRGGTYSIIVLDEFESLPNAEEMWVSLRPTISRGGQVIVLSTPKSEGSLFHSLYMQAEFDEQWVSFSVPWNECPVYDEKWYEENKKAYTLAQWEQEFECKWGAGDDILFRYEDVRAAIDLNELYYKEGYEPKKAHYVMGIDFAGEGTDKTVVVVMDVQKEPFLVVDCQSLEKASAPLQYQLIEKMVARYPCTPLADKTGLGWGLVQNSTVPLIGVIFTSGKTANRNPGTRDWNIPREQLISNLVLGIEQKKIAIPNRMKSLIQSLYGARTTKKKSINADHLDALALAYWSAKMKHKPRKLGQKPYGL